MLEGALAAIVFVDGTMGDLVVATNPRQVKPDDVYALLEKAY
ncbi:MAG: hypothetical protein ABSD31_10865 [Candidatus Binataceae bacterium]|jgi:alcohol dehydrogenase class IV